MKYWMFFGSIILVGLLISGCGFQQAQSQTQTNQKINQFYVGWAETIKFPYCSPTYFQYQSSCSIKSTSCEMYYSEVNDPSQGGLMSGICDLSLRGYWSELYLDPAKDYVITLKCGGVQSSANLYNQFC